MERTKVCKDMKPKEKMHSLDILIPNLILTPLTCASLISEILKVLIFQKSFIPYPYSWLKHLVAEQKKPNISLGTDSTKERSQRVAESALDTTENIMSNIRKLFQSENKIMELLFLIGATPYNPKEVYRIHIPKIAEGHNECDHFKINKKYQSILLRSILLSEEWMEKMDQSVPLTNLYMFVKIANERSSSIDNNTLQNFIPSSSFFIPKTAQSLTINLLYDDVFYNCCKHLIVYEDKSKENAANNVRGKSKEKEMIKETKPIESLKKQTEWLQINYILKGFK